MARTLGGSCRQCRREGIKLLLKGTRCHTAKCAMERQGRNNPPGQHPWRRGKTSEYGVRLREKQKVKRYYGVLERQFMIYFRMAERLKGNTGVNLLTLLERRLDNAIYKAGFALSHKAARQLIAHGHIYLNGRKMNKCGYLVRPEDRITVKPSDKSKNAIQQSFELDPNRPVPAWLEVNQAQQQVVAKGSPSREDIQIPVDEQLIVELCSR